MLLQNINLLNKPMPFYHSLWMTTIGVLPSPRNTPTMHIYLLSSLTDHQQAAEIELAHQCLQDIPELTLADCFSAPFGGENDINSSTYELTQASGYQSLLMSRQRLQPAQSSFNKIQILERFMPRFGDIIDELTALP